jgi:hypothetical protein
MRIAPIFINFSTPNYEIEIEIEIEIEFEIENLGARRVMLQRLSSKVP